MSIETLSEIYIRNNLDLFKEIEIKVFDEINSTNIYAKQLALDGAKHGTLVVANHQTQGRGRLGRSFYSPPNSGIYLSIFLDPSCISHPPDLITVIACVAVCRAIETLLNKKPQIKWVNDIFIDKKKVCGILTEAVTLSANSEFAYFVVGIGININTKGFPSDIKTVAGSITNKDISRNKLIALIADNLLKLCSEPKTSQIINEYKNRSFLLGKEISFIKDNVPFQATVCDISNDAGLVVKLNNGEMLTLKSGEVSLGSSNFS